MISSRFIVNGIYEDENNAISTRYLEFELYGIISSIDNEGLVLLVNNSIVRSVKILKGESNHCFSVYIFVNDGYDVFSDEVLTQARSCIDGLIVNFITNAKNTDFTHIHYKEIGRYDNGRRSCYAESNTLTIYIHDRDDINDDAKAFFISPSNPYSIKAQRKLSMLSAIVSMDNIIARYIWIYEMLCNVIVPIEIQKQKKVNEYICKVFYDKSVDQSGVKIYKKGEDTLYGKIKYDQTPHLTLLRNTIAHSNEFTSNQTEFESDAWRHTRPLLNVLVFAIKEKL